MKLPIYFISDVHLNLNGKDYDLEKRNSLSNFFHHILQNGGNPGCGDIVTICLKIENDIITDFKFEGEGCIVSQAGTSIISEVVLGKSTKEIMNMGPEIITDIIGEELALSRPKCSTLGISTVKLAIKELEKIDIKKQASS